jgi:hypothetical protein
MKICSLQQLHRVLNVYDKIKYLRIVIHAVANSVLGLVIGGINRQLQLNCVLNIKKVKNSRLP